MVALVAATSTVVEGATIRVAGRYLDVIQAISLAVLAVLAVDLWLVLTQRITSMFGGA
jgi:hypothetical protein